MPHVKRAWEEKAGIVCFAFSVLLVSRVVSGVESVVRSALDCASFVLKERTNRVAYADCYEHIYGLEKDVVTPTSIVRGLRRP